MSFVNASRSLGESMCMYSRMSSPVAFEVLLVASRLPVRMTKPNTYEAPAGQ